MQSLYFNANILTLENNSTASAMIVENGLIKRIGNDEDLLSISPDAEKIDLDGKTVMPAFIDAHSHLASFSNSFLQAQLESSTSFEDIVEKLKAFAKENNLKNGDFLIANGYDNNNLKEKRHPTRELLDAAFENINVVLQHKSGHFGVFNSKALETLGIVGKDKNGYLEENAYVEAIKSLPMPKPQKLVEVYKKAQQKYASFGITTVQEGMMVKEMLPLYKMLLADNIFILDVVGYPQICDADLFYKEFSECADNYYKNFRLGGYKEILDGSPQGKTAFMKTPYVGTTDEFGVSNMSDSDVLKALEKAVLNHRQLLSHANGDAAAEQLLNCAEKIHDKKSLREIRPVIIHAQLLPVSELKRVKELGFIPSFFVAHTYHWGDTHIKNFGRERAEKISPAKSALDEDVIFTFHQDTPVIEPNMLETVWCAVNRVTKSGIVLGESERIPVIEALKAVTANAAYQYGEENSKGTLKVGKKADFIVLSENPLSVSPEKIRDINILKTFKSGKCIFVK